MAAFKVPSLAQLQELSKISFQQALAKGQPIIKSTIEYGLGQAVGAVVYLLIEALRTVWDQLWPDTATGRWLDRHAQIWGLARKDKESAIGKIGITGTNGTVLPLGATFERDDGATFSTLSDATIVDGEAVVKVVADLEGVDGNTDVGAELTLVDAEAGIDDAATVLEGTDGEAGIVGGLDLETDDDLRVRLLLRISDPPKGGTLADYKQWALGVGGITRAWATAGKYGAGTIEVLGVNDNADPITLGEDKLAELLAYLTNEDDGLAPATDEVFVGSPELQEVDLTITLSPNDDDVQAAVTAKLEAFFRARDPGEIVRLSNISEAISAAAGEEWHQITDPSVDVVTADSTIPVLGTITFEDP